MRSSARYGLPLLTEAGVAAVAGSDTAAGSDASALTAAVGGNAATPLTRSASGAAQLVIAGGTIGTSSAHRAFPTIVDCADGTQLMVYRRATSHASYDGSLCGIRRTAGVWGSEFVIRAGSSPSNDFRPGQLRKLASGRLVYVVARRTTADKFYPEFGYSDANGSAGSWTWTSIAHAFHPDVAYPDDIIEWLDGTLEVAMYGSDTYPATSLYERTSRSTNGGTSFTSDATLSGLIGGFNAVEAQLARKPDGSAYATFHTEDGAPTDMYYTTRPVGGSWATPTLLAAGAAANRNGMCITPDGDYINAYFRWSPAGVVLQQSSDGVTYNTAIAVQTAPDGTHVASVWASPAFFGSPGVSPNLIVATAWENLTQDQADIYVREFTAGATTGGGTDSAAATESAAVNILATVTPKSAADTAAATDASSVAASTPVSQVVSDAATTAEASSVVEIEAPDVVQAGNYDLRLGRVRLPTLLDSLKETVGEQIETVGATAVAGERRARPANLVIPVHGTGQDGKSVADRMRRQLRALLANPVARLAGLHLAFVPDPELSGWLLIGSGDLEYDDGGVVFGDYKLALNDAYVVARQRSHLQARRIEVQDRRLATTPRDTKGTIFSTAFSTVTPIVAAYMPGAMRYLRSGAPFTGTPVASVLSLMGSGTPQLLTGLTDGDVVVLDGVPSDTQLQAAELGDVIVLDRQGVAATTVTAARDVTPQSSYGWEELYGPDQPISYPSGAPTDLVVQNGVCRVTCNSAGVFTVERMTTTGFVAACTVNALIPNMSTLQLRDANIVHWTPDETVVRFQLDNTQANPNIEAIGRCEMYVTLRRGWDAPRFEAYLNSRPSSTYVRLRIMHAVAGTTALDTSTTGTSNITDGTDYGTFASRDPWFGLSPSSGAVILGAVTRTSDKIIGRVVGSQRGVEVTTPAAGLTSYASVQLSITTAGPAAAYGPIHAQRCMADVRTIPTFVAR